MKLKQKTFLLRKNFNFIYDKIINADLFILFLMFNQKKIEHKWQAKKSKWIFIIKKFSKLTFI